MNTFTVCQHRGNRDFHAVAVFWWEEWVRIDRCWTAESLGSSARLEMRANQCSRAGVWRKQGKGTLASGAGGRWRLSPVGRRVVAGSWLTSLVPRRLEVPQMLRQRWGEQMWWMRRSVSAEATPLPGLYVQCQALKSSCHIWLAQTFPARASLIHPPHVPTEIPFFSLPPLSKAPPPLPSAPSIHPCLHLSVHLPSPWALSWSHPFVWEYQFIKESQLTLITGLRGATE